MAGKSKPVHSEKYRSIELQGKRKVDNAWHDCEVSLSSADPSSTSLNVHFVNLKNDENSVILRKEEALACLRVRSTNLSDGQCQQVEEGEVVIALQKTHAGRHFFFDAEVEKVKTLKHSNKVFCRCTFEIRWLESELEGERVTVTASSIKQLVQKNIEDHPIVAAFFEAVASTKQSSLSPELPGGFRDDSVFESDIHALLEQQIEEIMKLADTNENATTNERSSKNRRGKKLNSKQSHENVNSLVERTRYSKEGNGSVPRKSSRKGKVVSSERVASQPISVNIAALVNLEKRPRLSPLAARAALAAAVWDSPLEEKRTDNVHVGKNHDPIGPMSQNRFRDQFDNVSLNLSDNYFETRPHNKGNKVPKTAKSIARAKSSKQASSNKLHANKNHDGRTNTKNSHVVSSGHSRLKRKYSASVAEKQEVSSDITSAGKESSAMTDAKAPTTEQSMLKRQRASKEVNSTRSRDRHLGALPTRSSPRLHVAPVIDKEETSTSLPNRETENYESTVPEHSQRETNRSSATTRFNVRKPKMEVKSSDLSEQDPENAVVSNNGSEHDQKINKNPQAKSNSRSKRKYKAASVERTKAKSLLIDDRAEDMNGATIQGSRDSNYDSRTSNKASLEAKNIKRIKATASNSDKQPSVTNGTAENSLGTVEERSQGKGTSKPSTSSVKSLKTGITSTLPEYSDGGEDKKRQKSSHRKMSSAKEGENSKSGRANADKNLKAQPQADLETKEQMSINVVTGSSSRSEILPRARTRSGYNKITQQ